MNESQSMRIFGLRQSVEEKRQQKPWVERYRPKYLGEVLNQENTTRVLYENFVSGSTMHYIFSGSPGTGKTSTILAFCRYLYGKNIKDYVLQVNAADDVKMSLGNIVYNFCKRKTMPILIPHPNDITKTISVNFKFVICDEADSLSSETQNSFHKSIDSFSTNTRFCFLCNYQNKIIKTISSRCYSCYFMPLEKLTCLNQMQDILINEKATYTLIALEKIYVEYNGDLRKCISTIQAMYLLYDTVTEETFNNYIHCFSFKQLEHLFQATISNNLIQLDNEIQTVIKNGYTPREILYCFIDYLLENEQVINEQHINHELSIFLSNAQIKCVQNPIPEFLLCEILFEIHRLCPEIMQLNPEK